MLFCALSNSLLHLMKPVISSRLLFLPFFHLPDIPLLRVKREEFFPTCSFAYLAQTPPKMAVATLPLFVVQCNTFFFFMYFIFYCSRNINTPIKNNQHQFSPLFCQYQYHFTDKNYNKTEKKNINTAIKETSFAKTKKNSWKTFFFASEPRLSSFL